MIDLVHTQAISCCNMVNDRFLHNMCILLNNLVKSLSHQKANQDTLTLIFFNSFNELILALLVSARHKHQLQASVRYVSARHRYLCYVVY